VFHIYWYGLCEVIHEPLMPYTDTILPDACGSDSYSHLNSHVV